MGSDPTPFLANRFLFYYKIQCIKKLKRNDIRQARRFADMFRFIDILIAAGDGGEFEQNFKEIFPPEFASKKENFRTTNHFWIYLF